MSFTFFSIYKAMTNKYYQKYKERFKKKKKNTWKILKAFWRRKKQKGKWQKTKRGRRKISKSFWGTKAETIWIYMRNYYLAHKK